MSVESTDGRDELQRLQAELASRRSIVHYAHAAVALLATLILGSAFLKLYTDQQRLVGWGRSEYRGAGLLLLGVAAVALSYAIIRALLGRRRMKQEATQYARMLALRKQLNLDDPSALLPK